MNHKHFTSIIIILFCLYLPPPARTPDSAETEERIIRIGSVAREKKAADAKKEPTRPITVMDDGLRKLAGFDPPPEMRDRYARHRDLFTDCKDALLRIEAEANRDQPEGMKAVRIYQEMPRKILEVEANS